MPTDQAIPFKVPGDQVTGNASASITGKTFVAVSGSFATDLTVTVATCGANAKAFGVAEYDIASGAWGGVIRHGIVPVTVGAVDLAAGVEVMSDSAGKAVIWDSNVAHRINGMCISAAVAGSDAAIALY